MKTIFICHEVIGVMYIIAVYRRPQLISTYLLSFLANYLKCIPHETVPTVILGDFNNDLLSPNHSTVIAQLLEIRGFKQMITQSTTDAGSLLDHIYVNFPKSKPTVDVVDTYYSDYDATYISIPIGAHASLS